MDGLVSPSQIEVRWIYSQVRAKPPPRHRVVALREISTHPPRSLRGQHVRPHVDIRAQVVRAERRFVPSQKGDQVGEAELRPYKHWSEVL